MKKRRAETAMEEQSQETLDDDRNQKREPEAAADAAFSASSDLSQQVLDRYSRSAAPQHRHLCATAAAMRSILQSESLPLTPPAYFAAAISSLSSATLDSDSAAAILSFLSIALPLVPAGSILPAKGADAITVLVKLLRAPGDGNGALSASTVRAAVKCVGVLMGFVDLEDWDSVKLGFEHLLLYSMDKRPKVRKCAQVFVEKVFRSFRSSKIIKEASKLVLSLVKEHMPPSFKVNNATTMSGSQPEHQETVHMLNVLKPMAPLLSIKVSSKILSKLSKLTSPQFSLLTRPIFSGIDAFLKTSRVDVIITEADNIITSLSEYISQEGNPIDTIISAATLLKCALDKLHEGDPSMWSKNLTIVFGCIAGLLTSETCAASQASSLLKELISEHVNLTTLLGKKHELFEEEAKGSTDLSAIKSICGIFENVLTTCAGVANEHVYGTISALFVKLDETSFFFMKAILLKLADVITLASGNLSVLVHLHECIGSAVVAMGPERILTLIPISFNAEDNNCSNMWLVPILEKYIAEASLGYFLENIGPLAESLANASRKVENPVIDEDLQIYAHDLLALLPAFCRRPTDLHQNIEPLAKFLIASLSDSSLRKCVSVSVQGLVKENRSILKPDLGANWSKTGAVQDITVGSKSGQYSKKAATRNIRALASISMQLLQSLTDVLFDSPPVEQSYLKDAIGCLASISDPSITKKIFISSLKKFKLTHAICGLHDLGTHSVTSDSEEDKLSPEKEAQRCLILKLASCLVEGASEDFINLIYEFVRRTLLADAGQLEAYCTLTRILEEHPWFCSSRYADLVDFVLSLKSPAAVAAIKSRFYSLYLLFIHALKMSLEDVDTKTFLILNEIILAMKHSDEEIRKAAYDILLVISSSLRNVSSTSDAPQNKLISMILGYLSGSSPHIRSAAVSALSLLVYKDINLCLSIPDIIPSLLALLQSKAVEVVKAVLGFVKVLVSSLEAKDLQKLLSDILDGVLPWSFVSRHHFRSKVMVILEIMIRKCGSTAVEVTAPEKYKRFIRAVKENRHGKRGSKDINSTETERHSVDASSKGRRKQKRVHKELPASLGEDKSPVLKKRKNSEINQTCMPTDSYDGTRSAKCSSFSKNEKSMSDLSRGCGKNRSRGKRKTDQVKVGEKNDGSLGSRTHAIKARKRKRVRRTESLTKK